ncbi:hypothetical protein GCM10022392_16890 [Mucilaginibacter panaciglaebae]|uniref:Lipoprotein n=2 Tax=Mucilaginibacter panaciglaebae TaxID=502331 RepID=A0ABP7WQX6_9SPHI
MIVLCLAACSSPQKKADNTDTVTRPDTAKQDTLKAKNSKPLVISSYCFLHRQGKDSTRVEFTVVNNYVQGLMDWFPYEKDGRSGVIEGTLKNDTLHAVWSYAQERTKDTMKVEFLLKSPTDLRQKPLIANMKNGRQQTDVKAGYTVLYKPSSRSHR